MWCPSVRPSRSWILSKRINIKLYSNFFSPSGSHTIHFFRTKRHGDIPTGTFLTGASNAGGVCRNRDNEPISGFIACCQCCNRPGVINMAPPDRGKLWHVLLVVSGGVCWWRETTRKCLWQEVSTLRQRQQQQKTIEISSLPILSFYQTYSTAYLNLFYGRMLQGLGVGLETYVRPRPWQHHWSVGCYFACLGNSDEVLFRVSSVFVSMSATIATVKETVAVSIVEVQNKRINGWWPLQSQLPATGRGEKFVLKTWSTTAIPCSNDVERAVSCRAVWCTISSHCGYHKNPS